MKPFNILNIILLFFLLTFANHSNAQWAQVGKTIFGETYYEFQDANVSMNSKGDIVALGLPKSDGVGEADTMNDNRGTVKIYREEYGNWVQLGSDIMGEHPSEWFGFSISLSNDGLTIAIGAPGSYVGSRFAGYVKVFHFDGSNWVQIGNQMTSSNDRDCSGENISLSADGTRIAIGADSNDDNGTNSGQVKVYDLIDNDWVQVGSNINGDNIDLLGDGVSLSKDGLILAIGSIFDDGINEADTISDNRGSVKIFKYDGSDWAPLDTIWGTEAGENIGKAISLNEDGSKIAVGYSNKKCVRVFENISNKWVQIGSLIESQENHFGFAIDLNLDGSIIAIGSQTYDGYVHVFKLEDDNWTHVEDSVSSERSYDFFGFSVAINANGTRFISCSPEGDGANSSSNLGHARIFENIRTANINELKKSKSNSLSIYPNPSNGIINIKSNNKIEEIQLINLSGKVLTVIRNNNQNIFNLSKYKKGIYFIKIVNNTETVTRKFIIQ